MGNPVAKTAGFPILVLYISCIRHIVLVKIIF